MKKFLYCFLFFGGAFSLQGCFWHSSTTTHVIDHEVVPANQGSTTVVSPQSGTTVTTTH